MNAENDLATRVRACLAGHEGVSEMNMFGGVGFMLNGNLVAGASKRGLLLRVGKERHA
ncbi:MAG: TfoX/Sxy family protein, partial [Hyphomicrobiales bacterium]|nr:TfoX/Sxy family protein [Hyphomicrobiales bacterium]